jgi:hypothetical protein
MNHSDNITCCHKAQINQHTSNYYNRGGAIYQESINFLQYIPVDTVYTPSKYILKSRNIKMIP